MFRNKILSNLKILFSGTILASILNFLNLAIIVKSIGIENNGILFLGQSYADFFNTLLNFQSYDAIIKFLPRSKNLKEKKNYIFQSLFLDIFTAILSFIIAILFIKITGDYLKWDNIIYQIVKILSFGLLFNIVGTFNGIFRITENYKIITLVSIIKPITILLSYLLGFYFELSIFYYAYINVISTAVILIVNIFFFIKVLKKLKILNVLNISEIYLDKKFIKFNIYTNLSSTFDLPVFQLVPFIINKYLGVSDVAIYKILEKIGSIYVLFSGTLSNVLAPEISKELSNENINGIKKLQKKLQKNILLLGVLILFTIAITKNIWLNYFIPNFQNYIISLYFYFIYLILTSLFMMYHYIFIYSGFEKYNIYILIVVNCMYIFLLINCTKFYGINGIIFSKIIQAMSIYTIKYIFLKKDKIF